MKDLSDINAKLAQANAALQSNDAVTAIGLFESILQLDPDQRESNIYLGRLYMQAGRHAEALPYLIKMSEQTPADVAVQNALGMCYYALQQFMEAERCYKQVVASMPDEVIGHANLAILYQDWGDREQAVVCSQRVIQLNPSLPAGHILLASSYKLLGQYEEAVARYDDALVLDPKSLEARTGKADSLLKLGDRESAKAIVETLVGSGIVDHSVSHTYAALARRDGHAEDAAAYIEKVFSEKVMTVSQKMHLHFTAGELYDHMDAYAEAFDHYREGNKLVQREYDEKGFEDYFTAIRHVYDTGFFAQMPRSDEQSAAPVFVVGMPRSGTSLVERILGGHPDIYPAGELASVNDISHELAEKAGVAYPHCMSDVSGEVLTCIASSHISFLDELSSGSKMVVDKMPHNFLHLGLISQLFPNARVIHCRRDPLDTCLSNYFQYFSGSLSYPYAQQSIVHHYRQYEMLMQHWLDVGIGMHEVDYEKLVVSPEHHVRDMLGYLGLDMHDDCLAFHKSDHVTRTASVDQVTRPLYTSSIGRWRHYAADIKLMIDGLRSPIG